MCQCTANADCNDGLNCTADSCDNGQCVHSAAEEGKICSDATGCNSGGTCKVGKCTGGKQQLWSVLEGDYGTEVGYDVEVLDTDLACLVTKQPLGGAGKAHLGRRSPTGEVVWSLDLDPASTEGRPALAPLAGGLAANMGQSLARVSADGKLVWAVTPTGGFPRLVGLGVTPAGGVAVAANQTAAKNWDVSLLTFGSDGQKALDVPVALPNTSDLAHAMAVTTTGNFVVAGVSSNKDGSGQFVVRFDATGKLLSSGPIEGSTAKLWTAAVGVAGGDVVLGGDDRVARINPDGKLVWERVVSLFDIYALAPIGDGGWMAVGNAMDNLAVARLAPNGVRLWDKDWGGAMLEHGWGLAILPNGAIGLAGSNRTQGKGYADAWMFRTDAFANQSCGDSGSCAAKAATGCDDTEFCTVNSCAAATGCVTSKLYGKPVCGDGKMCGDDAVCK